MTKRRKDESSAAHVIWVRLDALARTHPKILQAGAEAAWLWVASLLYANTLKAHDGFIPAEALPVLYPFAPTALRRHVETLVRVGLWERRDGGSIQIHDYAHFQPTAAELAKRSEARAMAGRIGGLRAAETRRRRSNVQASGQATAIKEREANPKHGGSGATKPDLGPVPISITDRRERDSLAPVGVRRGMTIPAECAAVFVAVGRPELVLDEVWGKFVRHYIDREFLSVAALAGAWETWLRRERTDAPAPSVVRVREAREQGAFTGQPLEPGLSEPEDLFAVAGVHRG